MKLLHSISFWLLIIGGLNWLLVGAFDWNLVDKLLGSMPMIAKLVYILVGLSAIYQVVTHMKTCKMCDKGAQGMM